MMQPLTNIPSMRELPPSAPARKRNGWVVAAIVMGTLILVGGCFNVSYALSHNICFTIYHPISPPRIFIAGGIAVEESSTTRAFRISDGTMLWQEPSNVQEDALAADDQYLYNATLSNNSDNGGAGTVSVRDRSTAAIIWQATTPPYSPILRLVATPTCVIGLVEATTGTLMAWRRTDGQPLWQATVAQSGIDARNTTVDLAGAALIYHDQSSIQAFDPATGHKLWQFADAAYANDIMAVSLNATSLIVDSQDPTDVLQDRLIAFQPTTGKTLWQATISHPIARFMPVLTDDAYYTFDNGSLVARQPSDGKIRWRLATTLIPSFTGLDDVDGALTLIGPGTNADGSTSPDINLFILDRTTGHIIASALARNAEISTIGYPAGAGKIWLTQDATITTAYDAQTASRLFSHSSPKSNLADSEVASVTENATIIGFSMVHQQCPVRHVQGIQALDVHDGHVLWSQMFTLPY